MFFVNCYWALSLIARPSFFKADCQENNLILSKTHEPNGLTGFQINLDLLKLNQKRILFIIVF